MTHFHQYGRALLRFAKRVLRAGQVSQIFVDGRQFFIIHSSERAPWHLFAVADGPNSVWLRLLSLNFPCCHAACSSWVHLFQIFTNRAEREYVGALESSHQMGGNDVSGRLMEITSYGQPLSDRHLPRISAWKANLPAFLCFLKKYSHGLLPREIGASISGAQDGDVLRCEAKAARKLLIINLSEPRTYALLRRIVLSLGESTHQARSGFQASGRTYGHPLPGELDRN
jgi:hypothetical protein